MTTIFNLIHVTINPLSLVPFSLAINTCYYIYNAKLGSKGVYFKLWYICF